MRDEMTDIDQEAIKEWLEKGNKITVCPEGTRTDPDDLVYTWGAKKKTKGKK